MTFYLRKPTIIEAYIYSGIESCYEIGKWVHDNGGKCYYDNLRPEPFFAIETKEGCIAATVGDYIVKGTHGEFYPVKPEIFRDNYSPVDIS